MLNISRVKRQKGFSLIELMVAVIIIGILTAIALPAYQDYVRKARRADAYDSLLFIQNLQEKWRANNTTYGSDTQIGAPGTSLEGHYTIAVSGNTATGYVLTATAGGDQVNDKEGTVSCTPLEITVTAGSPRGAKSPPECW